ncbi:MarR family transcriptional regulator [Microbacterium sp. 2FI]|uniref:MarR family winged helix-turn-helix transcriptional regulator n=1 Tax=Microbacterium sp. 2FI TaxID=2502193 RepID=UPI0010F70CD5|nr:MarR family transcriptional regulator [Microbacterium sp. 2FI]
MSLDATRLTAVISPLRRALLSAARAQEGLPDIPDAQVEIIRALPRGTVASPSELAVRLGLGRSTVSNLLAAMERSGLVTRRTRSEDRRQVDVEASPEALGYFGRFDAAASSIVTAAAASLSAHDIDALAAAVPALERLRDLLVDRQLEGGEESPRPTPRKEAE